MILTLEQRVRLNDIATRLRISHGLATLPLDDVNWLFATLQSDVAIREKPDSGERHLELAAVYAAFGLRPPEATA